MAVGSEKKESATSVDGTVNQQDNKQGRGCATKQVLAALVAQLGTINDGMVLGFSAITFSQPMAFNGITIQITQGDASWIASVIAIGIPIGCLFSGYMADTFGRKLTLVVTEILALLGWLVIAFATDANMILAGRFTTGLSSGMVRAPARIYAAEVTQPHLRGMLVGFGSVGVSLGLFITCVIGKWLQWNYVASISALVPLASIILILFFPETPSYLMSLDKPEKAGQALNRLRSPSCSDLINEMNPLVNFSEEPDNHKKLTKSLDILNAIRKPNVMKPFIMLFLYFGFWQWSGTNVVTCNASQILIDSGLTMNSNCLTIILGAIRILATVTACILCRRCGRRPLTFVSTIGCGLSMLGLGAYKILTSSIAKEDLNPSYSWFPAFCVLAYTICCSLGFLVIPWVMIGEIYPQQVRGIVGGLTTMSADLFGFSVVQTYDHLKVQMTDGGIYMLYGVVPLLGTIYLYFFLLETEGKSLRDIENYYSGKTGSVIDDKVAQRVDCEEYQRRNVQPVRN